MHRWSLVRDHINRNAMKAFMMQKQLSLFHQRHVVQGHKMGNLVKTVHHKKEDIKVTYGVQSFHGIDSSDGSDAQQIR